MISKHDYFNDPKFNYEDVREEVDKYVNEGIELRGAAKVEFNPTQESGRVIGSEGYVKGYCCINTRYLNELIYQVHKAGWSYCVAKGDFNSPDYMLIYIE